MEIEIYTDGACKQNIGKGGWAYLIVKDDNVIKKGSESLLDTTNNKCEMLAAINGIKELCVIFPYEKLSVKLYSDSAYLVNAFTQDWIGKWKANGWKNSNHEPVLNQEYWFELIELQNKYKVDFSLIKRRSSEFSIIVDQLAKKASNV